MELLRRILFSYFRKRYEVSFREKAYYVLGLSLLYDYYRSIEFWKTEYGYNLSPQFFILVLRTTQSHVKLVDERRYVVRMTSKKLLQKNFAMTCEVDEKVRPI